MAVQKAQMGIVVWMESRNDLQKLRKRSNPNVSAMNDRRFSVLEMLLVFLLTFNNLSS